MQVDSEYPNPEQTPMPTEAPEKPRPYPKLILTSYMVNPKVVQAGQTFTVKDDYEHK